MGSWTGAICSGEAGTRRAGAATHTYSARCIQGLATLLPAPKWQGPARKGLSGRQGGGRGVMGTTAE